MECGVAPTTLRNYPWARVEHSCLRSTTALRRIRPVNWMGMSGRPCGGELERHDVVAAPPMEPTTQPPVHAVGIGVA